jgi:hypothetical protein
MRLFEITQPSSVDLTSAINRVIDEWLAHRRCNAPRDINTGKASGCCDDFVSDVYEQFGGVREAESRGISDVSIASFMNEDGRFDLPLLRSHWKAVKPTQGLNWKHMNRLAYEANFDDATHVWLTYGGRHYDAECPTGVVNFFDLPFFVRVISAWKQHKGL